MIIIVSCSVMISLVTPFILYTHHVLVGVGVHVLVGDVLSRVLSNNRWRGRSYRYDSWSHWLLGRGQGILLRLSSWCHHCGREG